MQLKNYNTKKELEDNHSKTYKKYSNESLSIFFNIYVMYSLYVLKDPNSLDIRYVGYSNNPKRRLWEHIRDAKKGVKTHKSYWIKSLIDNQQSPLIEIIYNFMPLLKILKSFV